MPPDRTTTSRREKLYGKEFPDRPKATGTEAAGEAWRRWIDARIKEQAGVMRDKRLHWARHRHFRAGRQWISTRDGRTWRELDADKNTVRAVLDLIGPALDFRLGLLMEQRPGFKVHPLGTGVKGRETAEAQQNVAEHYYNRLGGESLLRDAASSAQTDGVAFLHVFADKDGGPLERNVEEVGPESERFEELLEEGYSLTDENTVELPLSEEGTPLPPGSEPEEFRLGDIGTRVVLAHQVFVDPEAKTVNGPYDAAKWLILRRVRDIHSARLETGNEDLEGSSKARIGDPVLDTIERPGTQFERGIPTYPATRQRPSDEVVFDYLVFIAPDEESGFERGLWRRVVGETLVDHGDVLPGGKIPLARITDGSSDPEFFPRPVMSDWIGDQLAINALVSKLIEHVRVYGAGRTMAQEGTVVKESYTDITGSMLYYRGQKPDFLPGVRVSSDSWQLLDFMVQKLQDKTGWTDIARGAVTGTEGGGMQDVAGRGILAARELFERQFGPMVRAAAEGMSDWAQLVVDYARFLFDEPRLIPRAGRQDLAARIEAADLGEESLVYVDPETLQPLPRALRNQMLFDLLEQGLINPEEYRKRAPFAELRNVTMGDTQQWERAQLLNTRLEDEAERLAAMEFNDRFLPERGGIAVYWQDDPAVHMRALNELILDDSQSLIVRDMASERWAAYLMLQQAQSGQTPPPAFVRGTPQAVAQRQAGGQGQGQAGGGAGGAPSGGAPPGEGDVPGTEGQPPTSPAPASQPTNLPQGVGARENLESDLQQ